VIIAYQKGKETQIRQLVIAFKGQIDPDYVIEPDALQFGDGRPPTQQLALKPHVGTNVKLRDVVCNRPFLRATILPSENDHHDIEVAFLPAQYYSSDDPPVVSVATDSLGQPGMTIPVEIIFSTQPTLSTSIPSRLEP
jgi:hypothetical protein